MHGNRNSPELYPGRELEVMAGTYRYQRWIAEQFLSYLHGNVMEIGAGIGTMARMWLKRATTLHLVEPARNLFPQLSANLRHEPKVVLHCGILEDILTDHAQFTEQTFDAIILINVLEHIANDKLMLGQIHRMLASDGYLLLFVPALPAIYGSIDSAIGHYRRYTKTGIATLCRDAGYEIVRLHYFDLLGVLPWWFVGRILRIATLRPGMANLYDAIGVPVTRLLEKLIYPPVGKNLVLVARKTGGSG